MGAETAEVPPPEGVNNGVDPSSVSDWQPVNHGGVRRLIASLVRLADIQTKIWLAEAKITLAKLALYVVLFGSAAILGILGIIFLLIGLFRVLTDVLGIAPVWAFLLFAGFFFLLAGTLVMVGKGILNRKISAAGEKMDRSGE